MPIVLSRRKISAEELRNAVYVGRPTKWGNPFSHLPKSLAKFHVDNVQEAVDRFREWVMQPEQEWLRIAAKLELRGKDLVCWGCKVCHAQVWLEIANEGEGEV